LIELMIVLSIIAIVLGITAYGYSNIRDKVRRVSCRENQRIIYQAAVRMQTENPKAEGADLDVTALVKAGYLKKAPKCPSGGRYAIDNEKGTLIVSCFNPAGSLGHGSFK